MLEELKIGIKEFLSPKVSIKRIIRDTIKYGITLLILFGLGWAIGFLLSAILGLLFMFSFDRICKYKWKQIFQEKKKRTILLVISFIIVILVIDMIDYQHQKNQEIRDFCTKAYIIQGRDRIKFFNSVNECIDIVKRAGGIKGFQQLLKESYK